MERAGDPLAIMSMENIASLAPWGKTQRRHVPSGVERKALHCEPAKRIGQAGTIQPATGRDKRIGCGAAVSRHATPFSSSRVKNLYGYSFLED